MPFFNHQPKSIPKLWLAIVFFILLTGSFILFMGRKKDYLKSDFLMNTFPDFYSHLSNFSISFILYTGVGYFWLMQGVKIRALLLLGFVIFAVNFIYELFIPIINTKDIIDAYYGTVGVGLGILFLIIANKYGFYTTKKSE